MADIREYTNQISTARYGEEVRGSIVNAILAINDDVEDDTASAGAYAQAAQTSANAAASSASDASQTAANLEGTLIEIEQQLTEFDEAEAARSQAEQGRVTAEIARVQAEAAREDQESGYVAQARQYAQQAGVYASSDYAKIGESWAVGGTGVRYGEDTNNSKYWAEVAAQVVTEGGVASFNGRTGNVSPEAGDYTAELIPYGSATVKSSLDSITAGFQNAIKATDPIEASAIDLYYTKAEVNALIQGLSALIESNIGTIPFSGTRNAAINLGTCRGMYDKASKTVRLVAAFTKTDGSVIASSDVIFTIPEDFRPNSSQTGELFGLTNQNSNTGLMGGNGVVHPNGDIVQTSTNYLRGGIIFIEYAL